MYKTREEMDADIAVIRQQGKDYRRGGSIMAEIIQNNYPAPRPVVMHLAYQIEEFMRKNELGNVSWTIKTDHNGKHIISGEMK